jgi:two-component system OmpR family response regulator/two-component system alkaline phosphatase synthesis response regulator PhoP
MEIRKILVVDDEKSIYSYLHKKFTKLGYTVFTAADGEGALAQAFAHLPHIILLDVKLPKLSGLEVLKRLKSDQRTKDIPVLILSAKAQSKEIKEGLEAGADKYLCKPLGFPDILREIRAFEDM